MREFRQQEAVDSFMDKGLIKAAPRFGKIKVAIDILKRDIPNKILICYPRVDIQAGWNADFKKFGFGQQVEFQTFRSIEKELDKEYDFIIIDEIHEASPNQLKHLGTLVKKTKQALALSGTCTNKTLEEICLHTDLITCYNYSIAQAVEEGILCDYKIIVHQVNLDNKILVKGKTEQKRFDNLIWAKKETIKKGKPIFHLNIKMMQLIQHSYAKLQKTKSLLQQFKGERVLVFCGLTEIADELDIPVYHSKEKEKQVFLDFCTGKGSMLATIKMAQAGITVLPINKGVINYTSGNPEDSAQKICRFLGFEYDNPGKKAEIHIVSTTENFEKSRLQTALMFFDESKINYVKN